MAVAGGSPHREWKINICGVTFKPSEFEVKWWTFSPSMTTKGIASLTVEYCCHDEGCTP
jgi:hypothetical protein